MQTLNEPIFEVNQESDFYKKSKERKDKRPRINEILNEIANTVGFDVEEFQYYGCYGFGFSYGSDGYEKFKDQLMKNADRNGVYKFKKTSAVFKEISKKLEEVDKINNIVNPFEIHDIFGINNVTAAQWLGDRYFVEVKHKKTTEIFINKPDRSRQYKVEPIKEVSYKDYLQLVLDHVNK